MNWSLDVASLGGSLINAFSGFSSVAQQQRWQRENMEYQQRNWEKQFNMINDYNSPANTAKRYQEGGISPSAAFGGSSVGQAQSSPALGSSGSPVGFPPTMQNGAQLISTISQALSSLGSAFKNTAEGQSIQEMLGEQLRGLKLTNDQQTWFNQLQREVLPKRYKKELAKLGAEELKLIADVAVASEEELLKIEQRHKTIAEKNNELAKGTQLANLNRTFEQDFNSAMALRRSQIKNQNAQAAEHSANASREQFFNQLRADDTVRQSLLDEMAQKGRAAVLANKISSEQNAKLQQEIRSLAFANDLQTFSYAWSRAMEYCHGVSELVNALGSFVRK